MTESGDWSAVVMKVIFCDIDAGVPNRRCKVRQRRVVLCIMHWRPLHQDRYISEDPVAQFLRNLCCHPAGLPDPQLGNLISNRIHPHELNRLYRRRGRHCYFYPQSAGIVLTGISLALHG